MLDTATHRVALRAHPTTESAAIRGLEAQISVPSQGLVNLRYTLRGDMSRIRIGAEVTPGPADGLWKHTCFEAFIQPAGSSGYYEFNFSPTRQWAVYRFDAYRQGMTPMNLANPPEISTSSESDYLELVASFPLPISADAGAALHSKVALAAVIEGEGGTLSYWAVRHPPGKPDFHHPEAFALELGLRSK